MGGVDAECMAWTIIDSGLPTGGFAHSLGLEAAAASGHVLGRKGEGVRAAPGGARGHCEAATWAATEARPDAVASTRDAPMDLTTYVDAQISSLAALELPFVFEAHASTDIDAWKRLDALLQAQLVSNPIARRASATQGAAFLRVAATGLASNTDMLARIEAMRTAVSKGEAAGLLAPVFGQVLAMLGVDARKAQKMYLFIALRDMLSAAKRLALIGPMAAVRVQSNLSARVESLAARYQDRPVSDAHQTFMLGDILHSTHDNLFRRLFLS
ncbi:Urease accessory protein F [Hondaea fermentalgiana]|uniref:Urease accessory protein F n=1 Tax=Hondaea fermentalgiana TaxID=2315210 RepID=A0A2R5G886_9STRA|nr:Urease accessory protein F [Hondaea fermentalgiana]|eukprot:GBG27257.1 Urease accessory protein F [Hondaea fermentalgiana]